MLQLVRSMNTAVHPSLLALADNFALQLLIQISLFLVQKTKWQQQKQLPQRVQKVVQKTGGWHHLMVQKHFHTWKYSMCGLAKWTQAVGSTQDSDLLVLNTLDS